MNLAYESLSWAIQHLLKQSDTDLFPRPVELDVISEMRQYLIDRLAKISLPEYRWNAARRFVIPKSDLSYRVATQLDPIDSIVASAAVYECGAKIERLRPSISANRVFSYRFAPTQDGTLYDPSTSWNDFWRHCENLAKEYRYVVHLDIADFYNQVYHHVLENQLARCEVTYELAKTIKSFLSSITHGVSRGLPVGPHLSHLLAELPLVPIDESLTARGYEYARYSDDIVLFLNSYEDAMCAVYQVAEILDKQQRLILQSQKTTILPGDQFVSMCRAKLNNDPVNDIEARILQVLQAHSLGDPYVQINAAKLTAEEVDAFSQNVIERLLDAYLDQRPVDFSRLRWFYRRLSQLGLPVAIDYSLRNVDRLVPAISDVCRYLISAVNRSTSDWSPKGNEIFEILDRKLIRSNEFFQISLLNLFAANRDLNHFDKLVRLFPCSSENVKRKIILAAYAADCSSWIRERKEEYHTYGSWAKHALAIACRKLPPDERRFYIKGLRRNAAPGDIMLETIFEWVTR